MENALIFASEKEVRFTKLLKFIVPTYLTSLFNTVYTIIDGIFVSTYVGTNALASINIVYPIVNVLTGIALVFATGGSAVTALHIGGTVVALSNLCTKVFTLDKTITDFHFSLKAICNSAKRVGIIFLNYFIQYFPIR